MDVAPQSQSAGEAARKQPHHLWLIAVIAVAWLSGIAAGFFYLLQYETKGGARKEAPISWPSNSSLTRQQNGYTLVMFAHPKCPCTTSSINELAIALTRRPQVKAYVLIMHPQGFPPDWEKSTLWKQASTIPNVSVLTDADGLEAAKFGVQTSGHVMLYEPSGHLAFTGGITSGRGHEGDNAGLDAIVALASGRPSNCSKTEVFGCSLVNVEKACSGDSKECRN
jgi:hypothetical protein